MSAYPSRTTQLAEKAIYETFIILKNAGGQLSSREVMEQIQKNVTFTPWETETYTKTGHIRWQSILSFYTLGVMKAGFLRKQKGIWILTPEGEKAIALGPQMLLEKANEAYKVWNEKNKQIEDGVEEKDAPVSVNFEIPWAKSCELNGRQNEQ